jgi:hypothetical protein
LGAYEIEVMIWMMTMMISLMTMMTMMMISSHRLTPSRLLRCLHAQNLPNAPLQLPKALHEALPALGLLHEAHLAPSEVLLVHLVALHGVLLEEVLLVVPNQCRLLLQLRRNHQSAGRSKQNLHQIHLLRRRSVGQESRLICHSSKTGKLMIEKPQYLGLLVNLQKVNKSVHC